MNLNGKMKKLQSAIVHNGLLIKVETNQFYSSDQVRMINSYKISIKVSCYNKKKSCWGFGWYEILQTCSMPEIIFCLVDIYKAVVEWQEKI